jgi:hypothetical protein
MTRKGFRVVVSSCFLMAVWFLAASAAHAGWHSGRGVESEQPGPILSDESATSNAALQPPPADPEPQADQPTTDDEEPAEQMDEAEAPATANDAADDAPAEGPEPTAEASPQEAQPEPAPAAAPSAPPPAASSAASPVQPALDSLRLAANELKRLGAFSEIAADQQKRAAVQRAIQSVQVAIAFAESAPGAAGIQRLLAAERVARADIERTTESGGARVKAIESVDRAIVATTGRVGG